MSLSGARMDKFSCLCAAAALLCGGMTQRSLGAQTDAECDATPTHPLVEREGDSGDLTRSDQEFAVRVTLTQPNHSLSSIQFFVNGHPALEIQRQELEGFRRDGPTVHVIARVAVGNGEPGQLVLPANSDPNVEVFAYDDQIGVSRGCGRNPTPFHLRTG